MTNGQSVSVRSIVLVELSFKLITKLVVKIGLDLLSVAGGAGGIVQPIGVLSTVWLTSVSAVNLRAKACFKTTLPAAFLRTRKKSSAALLARTVFLSLQTASLRLVKTSLHATTLLESITVPAR